METLQNAKESINFPNISTNDESLLVQISEINLEDDDTVSELLNKINYYFQSNPFDKSPLFSNYLEVILPFLNPSNHILQVKFGIFCLSNLCCHPNFMVIDHDLDDETMAQVAEQQESFFTTIMPLIEPLFSLADDSIIIHSLYLCTQFASHSRQWADSILTVVNLQAIDSLIKTSSNIDIIEASIRFFSKICAIYKNKTSQEVISSAFSCVDYAIHNILSSPDDIDVSEEDLPILLSSINFLVSIGENTVWDTIFKNSDLLPYCNSSFLNIKKTSIKIAALRLIRRIGQNTLIDPSNINYPRVFELLHHSIVAVSQAALSCILNINPVDLSRMLANTDLLEHFSQLLINGTLKAKETLIKFFVDRAPNVDLLKLYNDELFMSLFELFTNTEDEKLKGLIAKLLIKFLRQMLSVDEDKTEEMKDMLRSADAQEIISEYLQESLSQNIEVHQLFALIDNGEEE